MTDPQDIAKLVPKGTVGTIYAGDHKTLLKQNLNIKTMGLIEKLFKMFFFSIISL